MLQVTWEETADAEKPAIFGIIIWVSILQICIASSMNVSARPAEMLRERSSVSTQVDKKHQAATHTAHRLAPCRSSTGPLSSETSLS